MLRLAKKRKTREGLIVAFPKLYEELLETKPELLLNTDTQVFKFIPNKIWQYAQPNATLKESLNTCIKEHSHQITCLLKILLQKMADGFSIQKGALFGFGPHAENSTGTLFKISTASKDEKEKLDKTATTNLHEERSVGFLNYEISVHGRQNLEAASKKMVLNKSFDLVEKSTEKNHQTIKRNQRN